MSVTLEVSQIEMSALKLGKLEKTALMLEMAETFQSAMGPYIARAAAGSSSNSATAVIRPGRLVKTLGEGAAAVRRSTGSHRGGQAAPLTEACALRLVWPAAYVPLPSSGMAPCAESSVRRAQAAAALTRLVRQLGAVSFAWRGGEDEGSHQGG